MGRPWRVLGTRGKRWSFGLRAWALSTAESQRRHSLGAPAIAAQALMRCISFPSARGCNRVAPTCTGAWGPTLGGEFWQMPGEEPETVPASSISNSARFKCRLGKPRRAAAARTQRALQPLQAHRAASCTSSARFNRLFRKAGGDRVAAAWQSEPCMHDTTLTESSRHLLSRHRACSSQHAGWRARGRRGRAAG